MVLVINTLVTSLYNSYKILTIIRYQKLRSKRSGLKIDGRSILKSIQEMMRNNDKAKKKYQSIVKIL